MELGKIIAKNLSDLRNACHLTLGQLSKLSGISKAMLSEIEKGDSNPTINTIWKIAHGLDVPYTKLIDDVEKEAALIRKPQNPMQIGETEAYRLYCYYKSTPPSEFRALLHRTRPPLFQHVHRAYRRGARNTSTSSRVNSSCARKEPTTRCKKAIPSSSTPPLTISISTGRTRCSPASSSTTIPNKKRRKSSRPETTAVRRARIPLLLKTKAFPCAQGKALSYNSFLPIYL